MKFDRESMSARFWELEDKKAAIEVKTNPLRAKRDAIISEIAPALNEERAIGKQIKAIEAEMGLVEIDQERAFISRGLGGKIVKRR